MNTLSTNFHIKASYQPNLIPNYCNDDFHGYYFQWGAYQKFFSLLKEYKPKYIIDVGCGQAHKLIPYMDDYTIIGIDYGSNIDYCKQHYPAHRWLDVDLEKDNLFFDAHILEDAAIICADVVEHLIDPSRLLYSLKTYSDYCQYMILTTPDRIRLNHGIDANGPPSNQHHVREWTLAEFKALLKEWNFPLVEIDHTVTDTARGTAHETITALIKK